MKSLNKKISAIVLAGMVVMGGVLSSGVSSFAASAKNVSVQENQQIKKVERYCNGYGKVINVDKDKKKVESGVEKLAEYLKSGVYKIEYYYNNGKHVKIRNPYEISKHLANAQYRGQKFVKIEFRDLYYLIELN